MTDKDKTPLDEEVFDLFDSDFSLLYYRMLIEGNADKQDVFDLFSFTKKAGPSNQRFLSEFHDETDASFEFTILQRVNWICEVLRIAKTTTAIQYPSSLLTSVIREIYTDGAKNNLTNLESGMLDFYEQAVAEAINIKDFHLKRLQKLVDKGEKKPAMFEETELTDVMEEISIQFLTAIVPDKFIIKTNFDKKSVAQSEREFQQFIHAFGKDEFLDHPNEHRRIRLPYANQLANFLRYAKDLPQNQKTVNIPFSSLERPEFDIVKLLSHLELGGYVAVQKWDAFEGWRVTFKKEPTFSPAWLNDDSSDDPDSESLETVLRYDEDKNRLHLGNKVLQLRKATDQDHLMRIISQEPEKEWFFSEIAEIYDRAGATKPKKFQNAAYNLKKKMAASFHVDDIFRTTKHSVQIDLKYLKKK